ncbi:hypothetical protein RND81_10G079500 [Saponaria officinalis]|uniref:Beta-Casp domain-containing protein n=1 Tax=Saponaria officinalis TaxID=3572 RepID=A0AAW1I1P8_SAPOF
MKLTCLNKGQGYHFPPCNMLEIGGFRVLLDCPLDLSALLVFSPVPVYSERRLEEAFDCSCSESLVTDSVARKRQKVEHQLDASSLIHAVPWFKTVSTLHLWDVSFIDVVLISSPMGMLGLPFLTRNERFSAKIYATEATKRFGQLLMDDLVSMHKEFKQFYGPQRSGCVQWMKWEKLDKLSPSIQEIILGPGGSELGGWFPLYSAADAKDCVQKVQSLKFAEETCYAGLIVIKPFSAGLDIGSSNWVIRSPKKDITILSSSLFVSAVALNFAYQALPSCDIVLYTDFSCLDDDEAVDEQINNSAPIDGEVDAPSSEFVLNSDESSEEEEQKLTFICSCAIDSVKAGGSVLIPIGRIGVILQLLEQMSLSQELLDLKVPMFFISSVAEELLSYTNIIPEWLCTHRQNKLFAGEPLFAHVDLVKEKKLHVSPSIITPELLKTWREPCIVFTSHWSLRHGPAVHLLQRWRGNTNSLLILEKGPDADLLLLPFKPMAMKVLQCSFLSGIGSSKVVPLLKKLQPKHVLFPEELRTHIRFPNSESFSVIYYPENDTLRVPSLKKNVELEISADLASQFQWITLKDEDINITRLKGDLRVEHGKHQLLVEKQLNQTRVDSETLTTVLQKTGINATVEQKASGESSRRFVLHVNEPNEALVEVEATRTVISSSDKELVSRIFQAVDSLLSSS